MIRLFLIIVLAAGMILVGCSKDEDEIEALEQEAADSDASAVMDSLGAGKGEMAGEQVDTAAQPETPVSQPEPTEPEPEPEPEYGDMEGYVVQLGSYKGYDLADYWADKYRERDFPVYIGEVELDGETYYRLRVGVYETYQEAKEVGLLLKDRYSADYWIDKNR